MARSFRTRYVVAFPLGAALLIPALAAGPASAKAKHEKDLRGLQARLQVPHDQSAVDKSNRKADTDPGQARQLRRGRHVEGAKTTASRS